MRRGGRPLRFLAVVLGGWVAIRIWCVWPAPPVVARREEPRPPAAPAALEIADRYARRTTLAIAGDPLPQWPTTRAIPPLALRGHPARLAMRQPPELYRMPPPASPAHDHGPRPDAYTLAMLGLVRYGNAEPPPAGPGRWSVSLWAVARGGRQPGGVATPQLGGSQAGARIAYALDDHGGLAIAGRIAGALSTRQQEAAIGVEWRLRGSPLRLVAERRIGIARTAGGFALGAVGGVGDQPLALGFRLDGYGQAGVIARGGGEGYADGALRVARPVAGASGGIALDLGIGAWGAAQRGAARLDIGPSAAITLPLGTRALRVSFDWRQRIAGDARPVSGPALSIGTDF